MIRFLPSISLIGLLTTGVSSFSPCRPQGLVRRSSASGELYASENPLHDRIGAAATAALSIALLTAPLVTPPAYAASGDTGASTAANSKITTGGASTLQSGRVSTQTYMIIRISLHCVLITWLYRFHIFLHSTDHCYHQRCKSRQFRLQGTELERCGFSTKHST